MVYGDLYIYKKINIFLFNLVIIIRDIFWYMWYVRLSGEEKLGEYLIWNYFIWVVVFSSLRVIDFLFIYFE